MSTEPITVQIRRARQRVKLSQAALAERVGFAQSLLSRYETGEKCPPVDHLIRLARATKATFRIGADTII